MWDLHGPGIRSASPALAGRFLATRPPRKSFILIWLHLQRAYFQIRTYLQVPAVKTSTHLKKRKDINISLRGERIIQPILKGIYSIIPSPPQISSPLRRIHNIKPLLKFCHWQTGNPFYFQVTSFLNMIQNFFQTFTYWFQFSLRKLHRINPITLDRILLYLLSPASWPPFIFLRLNSPDLHITWV